MKLNKEQREHLKARVKQHTNHLRSELSKKFPPTPAITHDNATQLKLLKAGTFIVRPNVSESNISAYHNLQQCLLFKGEQAYAEHPQYKKFSNQLHETEQRTIDEITFSDSTEALTLLRAFESTTLANVLKEKS